MIASLWRVQDAATSLLMQRFYFRFLQRGADVVEALQGAMVSMIRAGFTVREWAPFVVYGLAFELEGSLFTTQCHSPPSELAGLRQELLDRLGPKLSHKLEDAIAWCLSQGTKTVNDIK